MTLYHLDIREGDFVILDDEGEEHPDLQAARASALIAAKELSVHAVGDGEALPDVLRGIIEIRVGNVIVDRITYAAAK